MNRPTGTISYERDKQPPAQGSPRRSLNDFKKPLTLAAFILIIAILLIFCTVIIAEIVHKVNSDPNAKPAYSAGDVAFENSSVSSSDIHTGNLILVNDSYNYVFPVTTNLVKISSFKTSSYLVADDTRTIEQGIMQPLNEMMDAMNAKLSFSNVMVAGAYRSYERQEENHAKYTDEVAAGASDHHTGLAVDLNIFDGDTYALSSNESVSAWFIENCFKYGFIDRYPDSKESITGLKHDFATVPRTTHLRYVGYPHAYYMWKNSLVLEEYLQTLRTDYTYNDEHLIFVGEDGNSYEVYYVAASNPDVADSITQIPLPTNYRYSVSGDNIGGFIVTVFLSQATV